ncbi:MAG TPA: phosphotransferase [Steroidobacteraceae bacterium]|nr:phosphotransferase [Steroidobacteraceae bacterium]
MRRSEIEALALRHVPGHGRPQLRRVGAGFASETYSVRRDGARYSLRIAAREPGAAGFDAHWEYRVRELAAAAGLAPPLVRSDPQAGVLLASWVDGRFWSGAELRRPQRIAMAAQLMRRIHAVRPPLPARQAAPGEWIVRYQGALRDGGPPPDSPAMRREAGARLAALARLPAPAPVLCHSDLHARNVVETGGALLALDWEYAHVTDPLWDLAGWCCAGDFSAPLRGELLQRYLGRTPAPVDVTRLALLAWLYDYVCLLWSDVYFAQCSRRPGAGPLARAQQIASRLQSTMGGCAAEVAAD